MVRVAAVQMRVDDDPERNLERILKNIRIAKQKRAKIVCFPETSLVSDHTNIVPIGTCLKKIKASCRENKIFCIFSSYVKKGGDRHNIAFVIDDSGKIIHKYKKAHLWGVENTYIKRGKSNKIIKTRAGNIGVIICFDFSDPNHVAKLKEADIIFCPSFMIDFKGREDVIHAFPVMRAFENMAYFVLCDAYTDRTAGYSCITGPFRVMKRLEGREGMLIADIDTKRTRRLKQKFKS